MDKTPKYISVGKKKQAVTAKSKPKAAEKEYPAELE